MLLCQTEYFVFPLSLNAFLVFEGGVAEHLGLLQKLLLPEAYLQMVDQMVLKGGPDQPSQHHESCLHGRIRSPNLTLNPT